MFAKPHDNSMDIIKKVNLDALSYDGWLEPKIFFDQLADLNSYCECYNVLGTQCICFIRIKLLVPAKQHWQSVQSNLKHLVKEPIILWVEMKQQLKQKYLPIYQKKQLIDQQINPKLLFPSVIDYLACFKELQLRCNVKEESWVIVVVVRSAV